MTIVAEKPKTKLERLNELLISKEYALKLPDIRSEVDPSGRNLEWLRKNITPKLPENSELRKLLALAIPQLIK